MDTPRLITVDQLPFSAMQYLKRYVRANRIAHAVVADALKSNGWKIVPHTMGHGTIPRLLCDPMKFIRKHCKRHLKLSNNALEYTGSRWWGNRVSRFDIIAVNERRVVVLEVKSAIRPSRPFVLNDPGQLLYYLRLAKRTEAVVTFAQVIFSDPWTLCLARFPEGHDLVKGSFKVYTLKGWKPPRNQKLTGLLMLHYFQHNPLATPQMASPELNEDAFDLALIADGLAHSKLLMRKVENYTCSRCRVAYASELLFGDTSFCPKCGKSLEDRSQYEITEAGSERLDFDVGLLNKYKDFLPDGALTCF
jgi:hypothetical protein